MIWKFVGGVSALNGLVFFGLSSTYDMSFGKLGFGGPLFYLLVGLIIGWLIVWAKRIRVSEKVKGVVAALLFAVISSISFLIDKLVAGKSSDVMSIISYGSFALMSVSMSRKFELGFETGFSAFFLQLFAAQLYKIKWTLLPIAFVLSSVIIILRHYSESGVRSGSSITPNVYHLVRDRPPNSFTLDIGDEISQDSPGQSLLSTTNDQENHQEESSSQAMHYHSPSYYTEVSEESILHWDNQHNSEEDETHSSFLLEEEDWKLLTQRKTKRRKKPKQKKKKKKNEEVTMGFG